MCLAHGVIYAFSDVLKCSIALLNCKCCYLMQTLACMQARQWLLAPVCTAERGTAGSGHSGAVLRPAGILSLAILLLR